MRKPPFAFVLIMTMSLAACSSIPADGSGSRGSALTFESHLFGKPPHIATTFNIHQLTEEQVLAYRRYLDDPDRQDQPTHRRVFDYLEAVTRNFSYLGETYTASEALDNSAGNCLALAILTTALARMAQVEVAYELTDSFPVFESTGNLIKRGLHVRTILYDPTWVAAAGISQLSRPGIQIDYFPSDSDRFISNTSESEYFAMYYRNIAGSAIGDRDLAKAFWFLLESLKFSPNNADSLNMLAIVYDRAGDSRKSEEIYSFGIKNSTRQVALLRNYGIFLRKQGRHTEAIVSDRQLAELDDPNPFDWIVAGQEAFENGDFGSAKRFFEKSTELAPYLHEGHFGLAKTYFRTGNLKVAEHELVQALNNANRPSTRSQYKAKLAALSKRRAASSR